MLRKRFPLIAALLLAAGDGPPAAVNPFVSAQQAVHGGHLRVAFLGDSITEGADVPDLSQTWAALVGHELRASLAPDQVVVHNYALGARSTAEYLNPAYRGMRCCEATAKDRGEGYAPRWEGDRPWIWVGQAWRDAVATFQPHLLIIAFGMNEVGDGVDVYRDHLTRIIQDAQRWPSHPSIILVSNMQASLTSGADRRPISRQALLDIAQVTRDAARSYRLPLVDVNARWLELERTHTQAQLLGTYMNGHDGNGYNHPTTWAHRAAYLETFRPLLTLLQSTDIEN